MRTSGAFLRALETKNLPALSRLLARGIELHSPLTAEPYRGRCAAISLLRILLQALEDFRFTDELVNPDPGSTPSQAVVFRARVSGIPSHGLQLIKFDDNGLVIGITMMISPLPAAMMLAEAVGSNHMTDN